MAHFWREVARSQCIWALLDQSGQLAAIIRKGKTCRLLWSTQYRLKRALTNHPEYANYTETRLSWQQFRDQWIPKIERNGELIAMDWVRKRLFAFGAREVEMLVAYEITQLADRDTQ